MNKNKTIWIIILLVIVVLALVYIVRNNSGSSSQVIKIGFIGPLTGDAAVYGEPLQNTVKLAVDEINSSGGINGKPIQFIYEDGKCNGQGGANAAQKLINVDNVQVILGGFCSGETLPAVPIAAQAKVLMLSAGASSPALTNISPYFFRDYPSDNAQGKSLADVSYNRQKWRTVGFIQEQTDYAVGLYKAFNETFVGLGGKTINQAFPTETTDFRSILTNLKNQKPDALFIDTQTPQAASRILKQLQELKWKLPFLIGDAIAGDQATLTANAAQLEGTLAAEVLPDSNNSKFQNLEQAYKSKYGKDFPYQIYMASAYDAVYLLKDGIASVGYDGTKLAAWSRTIHNWQGASGVIKIGADGDRVGGHVPEVVHNGKTQILK